MLKRAPPVVFYHVPLCLLCFTSCCFTLSHSIEHNNRMRNSWKHAQSLRTCNRCLVLSFFVLLTCFIFIPKSYALITSSSYLPSLPRLRTSRPYLFFLLLPPTSKDHHQAQGLMSLSWIQQPLSIRVSLHTSFYAFKLNSVNLPALYPFSSLVPPTFPILPYLYGYDAARLHVLVVFKWLCCLFCDWLSAT